MLYLIQIGSATRFALARDIDPKYGAAFDRARARGVEAIAWRCVITRDGIEIADAGADGGVESRTSCTFTALPDDERRASPKCLTRVRRSRSIEVRATCIAGSSPAMTRRGCALRADSAARCATTS